MSTAERLRRLGETEAQRQDLLHRIGTNRNSVVISYLTSTRPGARASISDFDVSVIERHVQAARALGARNLDLFIVTSGGSAVAPWNLIAMVREHFKTGSFRLIIPAGARSAGALIALGADEIVMGPSSVLGPVDAQLGGGLSSSDFQGFSDLVRDFGLRGGAAQRKVLDWLTSQEGGLAISALYRLWKDDRRITLKLLESRRAPLSKAQNERILRFMLYDIVMHNQSIRRAEARQEGISFITDLEQTGLETEVTDLYNAYARLLRLNSPFARYSFMAQQGSLYGDEKDFDVNGEHLSLTPATLVESLHVTNAAYLAYAMPHWDEVPPVPASPYGQPVDAGPLVSPVFHPTRPPPSVQPLWLSSDPKAPMVPHGGNHRR